MERQKIFLVIESYTRFDADYKRMAGSAYDEEGLRTWANDRFGVPLDATLQMIAARAKIAGWFIFEQVMFK